MKLPLATEYADLDGWHWWFRGRRRILSAVLRRQLGGVTARRLLSAGSGPASALAWLSPFVSPGGMVVALDLEPLHARPSAAGVTFVVGSLPSPPLRDGSFDVVLVLDVLEHLDDDLGGLRYAAGLLVPGGLLLVTVPALPSLWGVHDVVNEHRRRYTRRTLRSLLTRAGLRGAWIGYFNSLLFPAIAALRWLRPAPPPNRPERSDFAANRPGLVNELLAAVFAAEHRLVQRLPLPCGVSLLGAWRAPPAPAAPPASGS